MDFVTCLKTKYSWLSNEDLSRVVNKAKMIYYGLRYPCEPTVEHTLQGFFEENWILSACDELIERLGFNSAVGYKENGMSWSFDGAQISVRLCQLVQPIVSVV